MYNVLQKELTVSRIAKYFLKITLQSKRPLKSSVYGFAHLNTQIG